MLKFQFKFKFPLLFFFLIFGRSVSRNFYFWWIGKNLKSSLNWEKTPSICRIPLVFVLLASLFLLGWYRTAFSEGLMASFWSTPSLGQIFRAAFCSSHCCVYRQTFNKAFKLLSSFETLATFFCVGSGHKNWALMLCGWVLLLFLTSEEMSGCPGGGSWGL